MCSKIETGPFYLPVGCDFSLVKKQLKSETFVNVKDIFISNKNFKPMPLFKKINVWCNRNIHTQQLEVLNEQNDDLCSSDKLENAGNAVVDNIVNANNVAVDNTANSDNAAVVGTVSNATVTNDILEKEVEESAIESEKKKCDNGKDQRNVAIPPKNKIKCKINVLRESQTKNEILSASKYSLYLKKVSNKKNVTKNLVNVKKHSTVNIDRKNQVLKDKPCLPVLIEKQAFDNAGKSGEIHIKAKRGLEDAFSR